jgi:hypothetical protein
VIWTDTVCRLAPGVWCLCHTTDWVSAAPGRCVGATLGLGYAIRALRDAQPELAIRVATALCGLVASSSVVVDEIPIWVQFAAAFALGTMTTTDLGALDADVVPPLCDSALLQLVVTTLLSGCIFPPSAHASQVAAFVGLTRGTALTRGSAPRFGAEEVVLATNPHRGHSALLMGLGFTAHQLARAGSNGRQLLVWLQAWAGSLLLIHRDDSATPGALCLLAATTAACCCTDIDEVYLLTPHPNQSIDRCPHSVFTHRGFQTQGRCLGAAMVAIDEVQQLGIARSAEAIGTAMVARVALAHSVAIGCSTGLPEAVGTIERVMDVLTGDLNHGDAMIRAAVRIGLPGRVTSMRQCTERCCTGTITGGRSARPTLWAF